MERIKSPEIDNAIATLRAGGVTMCQHPLGDGRRIVGFAYDPEDPTWSGPVFPSATLLYLARLVDEPDGAAHATG